MDIDAIQIIVDSHSEADQIIAHGEQLIKKYDYLSVADLYDLTANVGTFEDTKIGWTTLDEVVIDRTTDGLSTSVTFPAPLSLNI